MKTAKGTPSNKSAETERKTDRQPEPLEGKLKKEKDILECGYEGKEAGGNAAAKTEEQTRKLDGSNANSLRTK
ncbi:hypothetical protein CLV24_12836 [Pontibacter ummariensis]|uniref:Uncharacterized protein n=1 Tax=Pontibacter ummariensis TaxID=1610492 RepID=A0A239KAD4_9BACT|nr:hypothetical protein [Pontibacter ummariensis]PRY06054.1 hypothetical protein CLV24_12836 [Pontibacter ummariensis]SNT14599.1 hypothetical protein SAMN06296052_12736 [Pontibacter ummariensis]